MWKFLLPNQGVLRLFGMFTCFEEHMKICHPWHANRWIPDAFAPAVLQRRECQCKEH